MRYQVSCKTDSVVLVSNPTTTTTTHHNYNSSTNNKRKKKKKIEEFTYRDLEAATNGFSDQKLLGRGSHGLVYKAVLPTGRHVAVKKPASTQQSPEVDNEIRILSNIQNPRLVNLVGFTKTETNKEKLLVVEFMSNGTLYQLLHNNPHFPPNNWGRRIRLALQTARAIDVLHSSTPPVIHRDIKSANVLIDSNFNARLGDFGLAISCCEGSYHLLSTPPAGTMGYLDPSYVTPRNLSTKTDVFSFGILLLEIISGRKAIDVSYSPPCIVDFAIPLIRKGKFLGIYDPKMDPPKDPWVRKHLAVIAARCVRSCKEKRPSMKEVVECLGGISKLVPVSWRNGFTNPCMMVDTIGKPIADPTTLPPMGRRRRTSANKKAIKQEEEEESLDGSKFDKTTKVLTSSRRIYSWNGFANPCMMVDTIGRPIVDPTTLPPMRRRRRTSTYNKAIKQEEESLDGSEFDKTTNVLTSSKRDYSWNGFTNPCMMVDTIGGRPVADLTTLPPMRRRRTSTYEKAIKVEEEEEVKEETLSGSKFDKTTKVLTSSKRVYSWNGVTNPCMMVETIRSPIVKREYSSPTRTRNENFAAKQVEEKGEESLDGSNFDKKTRAALL